MEKKLHSEIIQLLEQVDVISALTNTTRAELAQQARLVTYSTGGFIVRQGKLGNSLFIIHSGACEVFVEDQQGFIKKVAQTQRGDFFGEMSLLTGEPSSATVRAIEDTTLVAINKQGFAKILEAHPEIPKELGKVLSVRQKELAALTGRPISKSQSSGNFSARIKSFFKIK